MSPSLNSFSWCVSITPWGYVSTCSVLKQIDQDWIFLRHKRPTLQKWWQHKNNVFRVCNVLFQCLFLCILTTVVFWNVESHETFDTFFSVSWRNKARKIKNNLIENNLNSKVCQPVNFSLTKIHPSDMFRIAVPVPSNPECCAFFPKKSLNRITAIGRYIGQTRSFRFLTATYPK